ncbi:MAG TPA: hypothetical protein VLG93_06960 [Sulfuricaulis sp.]|nr:hypothetical protein [Sulfuricaulis sp.]
MSAAATLKAALTHNGLTLDQLVGMRERDALRLPWIGPKVWAEAKRQASKRGGARTGAGRKAEDGATDLVQIGARIREDQKPKWSRLGSVWLRRAIDDAEEI